MLLGKRPRHLIRRTTSMSGITVDLSNVDHQEPSDNTQHNPPRTEVVVTNNHDQNWNGFGKSSSSSSNSNSFGPYDERSLGMMVVSPTNIPSRSSNNNSNSNDSGEYLEIASFLRTCGLCRRRLVPGRDIYMYRGDTAFCSQECREKKIKHDERKEKAIAASKREGPDASNRY